MNTTQIQEIIFSALTMTNHIREDNNQIPIAPITELYSKNGYLDSMGLVAFLIDVEELFLDEDIQISLSDDRAMSQTKSPFLSVETLTQYIVELLQE